MGTTTKTKVFNSHGVTLEYKTQPPKQDRRHLVVVFSGFCPIGRYNFDGSVADGCRFAILWINDVFDGNNCYYLCRNLDFSVESAVIALVDQELTRLGYSKDECTLFGYSKGGSAALYFGLKYGFKNIVASAPQMLIGSFSRDNFPASYNHMTGNNKGQDGTDVLDRLIPTLLESDRELDKNIYLISSLDDQFHHEQIAPYLGEFKKYANFNLIMTESELVREHKTLGRYNTPIILSILYALGEGSAPRFVEGKTGQKRFYSSAPPLPSGDWVVTCDQLALERNTMYTRGVALLMGIPQRYYRDKKTALVLASKTQRYVFPMGSTMDESISDRFYSGGFCDYSAAGYSTLNGMGIDLSEIPNGSYSVLISVKSMGSEVEIPLPYAGKAAVGFGDTHYMHVSGSQTGVRLTKRPLIGRIVQEHVREVKRLEVVNGRLHLEGIYAIPGVDYSAYNNDLFRLLLVSKTRTFCYRLGQGDRSEVTARVDSGFGDYSKSYFASPGYRGHDVVDLPDGTYEMYVSTFVGPSVFTMRVEKDRLEVSGEQFKIVRA